MTIENKLSETVAPLTERPVPAMVAEQLGKFSVATIRAKQEGSFSPDLPEDKPVVAIDIGGDSISAVTFQMSGGKLETRDVLCDQADAVDGKGYLEALVNAAHFAEERRYPVGISFAGPLEGTKPLQGANVPVFMDELKQHYDGDFANVFPTLTAVENDAVAGLMAGALHAESQRQAKTVIYLINGSGMNSSVLMDGKIISMESGHVEVVDQLNPLGQDKPCGLFGAQYTCVESVAANKAGIEDLWHKQKGQHLSGREIEQRYLAGDHLAADLYEGSAEVSAHVVLGVARALGIDLAANSTAIVAHGGTFKFPHYGDRVSQILSESLGGQTSFFMTKDFSSNACLEGAALAALAKTSGQ